MTEPDFAVRRRKLTDDIAEKSARLMEMSRRAGPDGRQLTDVLADAAQSEQDTEPAGPTDPPPITSTTLEPAPPRPKPDASQGVRGSIVDNSLQPTWPANPSSFSGWRATPADQPQEREHDLMTPKTKTAPVDPEQARHEADRLTALARQAQDKARDAEADLATARQAAERGYWQDQVTRFYATDRHAYDQAWRDVEAAARSGDGAAVLSAWLAFRQTRGRVRGLYSILMEQAKRLDITGVRPHLSGVDSPERRKLGAALDAITDRLEDDAYRDARALLNDGAADVCKVAETDRRQGRAVDPAAELVPVAEFHSPDFPELTVNLGDDVSVRFHNGHLAVHDDTIAERLRQCAEHVGVIEVADGTSAAA